MENNNAKTNKIRNIATVAVFFLMIVGVMLMHIIMPDKEISESERRKLDQLPEISASTVFNAQFSVDMEDYLLDQFPFRDQVRTIKSIAHFYLLGQADNNGIYISPNGVSKLEYPIDEKQVQLAVDKINSVNEKYFSGKNTFLSIIPDKNYFIADKNGYPAIDYDRLVEMMMGVKDSEYIDIFDCLEIGDYYVTDTHWSQENLGEVVDKIADSMGLTLPSLDSYEKHTMSPFYGVYYGQSALPLAPDKITYLTSATTDAAKVFNLETNKDESVYRPDRFGVNDSYDLFMSGAAAFQTITNPLYEGEEKTLVVFRDSFGSSLIPLLIDGYSTIHVVDLRYMFPAAIPQLIDLEEVDDVLWIYSTLIINSASILR